MRQEGKKQDIYQRQKEREFQEKEHSAVSRAVERYGLKIIHEINHDMESRDFGENG